MAYASFWRNFFQILYCEAIMRADYRKLDTDYVFGRLQSELIITPVEYNKPDLAVTVVHLK